MYTKFLRKIIRKIENYRAGHCTDKTPSGHCY